MAKIKLGQVVEVTWEDAFQYGDYATPQEAKEHPRMFLNSSGYLLRDDKGAVVIGMDQLPDGRYRDIKHIPRGLVVKVKGLQ